MDPNEKHIPPRGEMTLGDLISYLYEQYEQVYEEPELRNLAVVTAVEDLLSRGKRGEK